MRTGIPIVLALLGAVLAAKTKTNDARQSALDDYIRQATSVIQAPHESSPGSLFSRTGLLADGFRDLRASRVYDLVTIVVADKASAVSSGVTNTQRKSSAKASVTALGGAIKATRPLANLANTAGDQQLQSQGTTSRDTALTTTITAQVVNVLPNGNLVVQGQKLINVNSEHQTVTVRGIVRPDDLSSTNQVASDRVAMLEVRVDGKGVVNDAVKRPFILYRLLLGLLPF
jgi:flagellar L-ring protein precursor FlgH